MKIIDRYVIREFLVPARYCFLAFMLLFVIGDLFENLDGFIAHKVPWFIVGKYYLYMAPTVFLLTSPLVILLSSLYQLGYMSKHNETTALKASGVSFWRAALPFLVLGMLFSVLQVAVNEKIIPNTSRALNNIRGGYLGRDTYAEPLGTTRDNITFFSNRYNMSFFLDKLSGDAAEGMSVREFDLGKSLKREWYGKQAQWIDGTWWLFDGYVRENRDTRAHGADVRFFAKQEIAANISPEDLIRGQKDPGVIAEYMNAKELYWYMKRNFVPQTAPKELAVAFQQKLNIPFTIFIVSILAVAFGGRISKGGALASVGLSLFFYLAYYGISALFLAMGRLGKLPPVLAVWTPSILFIGISVAILRKTR